MKEIWRKSKLNELLDTENYKRTFCTITMHVCCTLFTLDEAAVCFATLACRVENLYCCVFMVCTVFCALLVYENE